MTTVPKRNPTANGTDLGPIPETLAGDLILPGSDAYDTATLIWNGMINSHPAAVIQPESTSDVQKAVGFVRESGLEISIKGGGHNIAGLALSDGGVTLDMSRLRKVEVDVPAMRARVGPGCTLSDVDRATQDYGLATTLGFVSETGVAGLTLGGGFGYLTRQFGWTVDDLLEVELVTASGEVLRASRDQNKDLFWALRGGGGNFGVATEFTYRLHQVGPEVTAGLIAWSADEADEVLESYHQMTDGAPRSLAIAVLMRNAPAAPWLPEQKHGEPMIGIVLNHTGPHEQAEKDLLPIRNIGKPWVDLIQRKEYALQQSMLDATMPKGMHYYWKSEFLPGLSKDLLSSFEAQLVGVRAPANQMMLFHLEGALAEHAEDDGAVGNRDAAFVCAAQSMWSPDSEGGNANRDWVRKAWGAIRPFSTGGNYINFQTSEEDASRISETYRRNMARLREIKSEYDPDNFFRVNRNIRPTD